MFKLYYCVIEDNNDPEKLGRVKIRIVGKHTENISDSTSDSYLPVTDLPWAQCIFPVSSPNISGQSDFKVPQNGSVGICSFLDEDEQYPVLLGTLAKKVSALPDFTKGFSDSKNSEHPKSGLVGESQISRLARNEHIDQTIIQTKKAGIETGVQCNGVSWSEPITEYDTEYPNNRVIETEKHIIEIDDTSGAERIHIYHKSGSFDEYFPDGTKVEKIKAKKILIIESDENILVKGNKNTRIEGSENVEIVGAQNIKVGGNSKIDITGNAEINASGTTKITGSRIDLN